MKCPLDEHVVLEPEEAPDRLGTSEVKIVPTDPRGTIVVVDNDNAVVVVLCSRNTRTDHDPLTASRLDHAEDVPETGMKKRL